MANFADDDTPYDFGKTIDEVIDKLEKQSRLLIERYKYIYLGEKEFNGFININGKIIFNSKKEKILGVYFDDKLNFEHHLCKLCKRACQK